MTMLCNKLNTNNRSPVSIIITKSSSLLPVSTWLFMESIAIAILKTSHAYFDKAKLSWFCESGKHLLVSSDRVWHVLRIDAKTTKRGTEEVILGTIAKKMVIHSMLCHLNDTRKTKGSQLMQCFQEINKVSLCTDL